eukprot:962077-Ditylum_brightwellii.AAC.1
MSAPGNTKYIVNYMILEKQIGLLDQESTHQTDFNLVLFPIAVVLDDQDHNSDGNAHHLNSDHNTTSMRNPEGFTNENTTLRNTSPLYRVASNMAREENLADFMRDHPPPIHVIPQKEEDTTTAHGIYKAAIVSKGKSVALKTRQDLTAQNGIIAEKRIRGLTKSARRQLLHAQSKWPDKTITNLWTYPLRTAMESGNTILDKEDASCLLSKFSNSPVQAQLKDTYPFRCPVFALQTKLQNQQHFTK